MTTISTRDKTKPLILIAAVAVGIAVQRLMGREVPWLLYVTEVGVFLVITAVMLPVEIRDVGRALRRVKPTIIALLVNFVFIPTFAWALGWLVLKNYPDFWAGALLYTLTPCIGWYLIFTDVAKGDVPWGIALLPWNITLQVLLLPLYAYILIGSVLPIDISALARSVVLFLVAPFVLSYAAQKFVIRAKGRDYFFGPFKSAMGEVKLWALVIVIVSMFGSQRAIALSEVPTVGLLIAFLVLFFIVLFILAVAIGRGTGLRYEETVTLAFTTTARNSEAVIGVAVTAFPGHPLVYLAIILGPVVELPMLLLIARLMLKLREVLWRTDRESARRVAVTP